MSVFSKKGRKKPSQKQEHLFGTGALSLGTSGWMEIRREGGKGGRSAYLSEVDKILKYSDTEIVLRLRKEVVSFIGVGLLLACFRSGIVEITGRFERIEFGGEQR